MHNCLLEGEKEGSEKVGRTMESHENAELREEGRGGRGRAKVHHVASVREREMVKGFDVSSRFGDTALEPTISGV